MNFFDKKLDKNLIKSAAEKYGGAVLQPFGRLIPMDGFEAVYSLVQEYGGGNIYIPGIRKVFGGCLEKQMLLEFDGGNARQLAFKYGFSERHVTKLLAAAYKSRAGSA